MSTEKKLQIRNSTAEFLIFTHKADDADIEVRVAAETVWLTRKLMAALFEVTVPTVNEHLANFLGQSEIVVAATIRNSRTAQREGSLDFSRNVEFYNLDAIIAGDFRVNSARATQFRRWATSVLRDFAIGRVRKQTRPAGGNPHARRLDDPPGVRNHRGGDDSGKAPSLEPFGGPGRLPVCMFARHSPGTSCLHFHRIN